MIEYDDPSLDLVVELARPSQHDEALDVGAGVGLAAFVLAGRVREVQAVDDRDDTIEEARRLAAELGVRNVTFARADPYALPFEEGRFSLVVCRNALHRLPEPVAALREMARVTSRGGRIVVYDLVVDELTDRHLNELARLREPAHRRHLTRDEFARVFAAAGLRVTEERAERRTVDLAYWVEAAAVPAEQAELIRVRMQELPVQVQAALDVAFSDTLVSFSYDGLAHRLEK